MQGIAHPSDLAWSAIVGGAQASLVRPRLPPLSLVVAVQGREHRRLLVGQRLGGAGASVRHSQGSAARRQCRVTGRFAGAPRRARSFCIGDSVQLPHRLLVATSTSAHRRGVGGRLESVAWEWGGRQAWARCEAACSSQNVEDPLSCPLGCCTSEVQQCHCIRCSQRKPCAGACQQLEAVVRVQRGRALAVGAFRICSNAASAGTMAGADPLLGRAARCQSRRKASARRGRRLRASAARTDVSHTSARAGLSGRARDNFYFVHNGFGHPAAQRLAV